jgi:hypothetical protein
MILVSDRECRGPYWTENSSQETTTTTAISEEDEASVSTLHTAASERWPCLVFFRGASPEDISTKERNTIWGKYYWPVLRAHWPSLSRWKNYILSFEVSGEQLGYPEHVVTRASRWPDLWHQDEVDPTVWRGVFPLTHKKKVLFTKQIKLRSTEIPRWKPTITLDRRRLEGEDA